MFEHFNKEHANKLPVVSVNRKGQLAGWKMKCPPPEKETKPVKKRPPRIVAGNIPGEIASVVEHTPRIPGGNQDHEIHR